MLLQNLNLFSKKLINNQCVNRSSSTHIAHVIDVIARQKETICYKLLYYLTNIVWNKWDPQCKFVHSKNVLSTICQCGTRHQQNKLARIIQDYIQFNKLRDSIIQTDYLDSYEEQDLNFFLKMTSGFPDRNIDTSKMSRYMFYKFKKARMQSNLQFNMLGALSSNYYQ